MRIRLFVALIVAILATCAMPTNHSPVQGSNDRAITTADISHLPDAVFQKWLHSYEEDTNDVVVYRPGDFKFPQSRGRAAIEFRAGGIFIDWLIGPNDVSQGVSGLWQVEGPDVVRVEITANARASRIYEIQYCDKDVLRVRVIPVPPTEF